MKIPTKSRRCGDSGKSSTSYQDNSSLFLRARVFVFLSDDLHAHADVYLPGTRLWMGEHLF